MHRWVGTSCALALALGARTSMAQEISVANEASLPRVDASGNALAKRSLTLDPERVSDQDCIDDQRIRFTVLLSDYAANATVQVWASSFGQDCSLATNRTGATAQCWRLVDGTIPLTPQQNIDIPVRRIMSGVGPFSPTATDATLNVCGKVGLTTVSVDLLYFAPGNVSTAAVDHTVAVSIDTIDAPGTGPSLSGSSTSTANGVGCSTSLATARFQGVATTALLGIAVAAFVRRRRR